jgi:hypothetical protein
MLLFANYKSVLSALRDNSSLREFEKTSRNIYNFFSRTKCGIPKLQI